MSIVIGLTGPTGAGKSSVAVEAERLGFKVIDCDKLARKAVLVGTDGYKALLEAFGTEILAEDKAINRRELARKAFSSRESTELLNKTLLPHIVILVKQEMTGDKILLDAPTLFESGINTMCDFTVAVLAERAVRLSRITARDGIDKAAAELRINAGKGDEFYKSRADYIIYNNGEPDRFISEFGHIIKEIMQKN